MRVLLLTGWNPRKVKTWVCQETSVVGSLIPPTDLCYIAAHVENRGHHAAVEDLRLSKDWRTALTASLDSFRPEVICTNLVTTSYLEDIEVMRFAKRIRPDAHIVAFGTHAESCRDETFRNGVEHILVGDPEAALLNMLEGRANGVATIGRPNPQPALLDSPDDLPFFGPRFIDLDRYHAVHHPESRRFLPLMASRGCPYSCTYCLYPTIFGSKARYRSPRSMVDELEYLSRQHAVESVNYLDATFNLHRKRLLDFCRELSDRCLPIRYACNVRADLLDDELLAAMARSRCDRLYLGVEDPDLFDSTKKGLTLGEVVQAFRRVRTHGIQSVAFLMLFPDGAQGEDEYVQRMGRLIDQIDPDGVQINISIPFPGTADFERRRHELDLDWSLYDPSGPERLPYPSDLDLVAVKRRLYRYFVLTNPGKVLKVLRRLPFRRVVPTVAQFARHAILPGSVVRLGQS